MTAVAPADEEAKATEATEAPAAPATPPQATPEAPSAPKEGEEALEEGEIPPSPSSAAPKKAEDPRVAAELERQVRFCQFQQTGQQTGEVLSVSAGHICPAEVYIYRRSWNPPTIIRLL